MWHGLILDSWRDILRGKKKHLGYSNLKVAELTNMSEGAVERFFADRSDPPISRIFSIAVALDVPTENLFVASLPNGMMAKDLIDDYARVSAENAALREEITRLQTTVESLRDKVDELKDEIIETHRHYIKLRSN